MWIPCDESLLLEAFNATEREAVQRVRQQDESDAIPGICLGLAARIRAAVLAGGRAKLQGGEEMIPQALRNEATAILRLKVLVRYALAVTEDRRREAQEAEERLDAIARRSIPFLDEEQSDQADPPPTYHGKPQLWSTPPTGGIM